MSNSDKIWRDKHGVCHVEGKDKTEVFGLMGYAHGKDRGMQIFLMRILGQGRASELLDSSDEMLEIDKFFRMAHAEFDTDGFATTETTEFDNKIHQFLWSTKFRVTGRRMTIVCRWIG